MFYVLPVLSLVCGLYNQGKLPLSAMLEPGGSVLHIIRNNSYLSLYKLASLVMCYQYQLLISFERQDLRSQMVEAYLVIIVPLVIEEITFLSVFDHQKARQCYILGKYFEKVFGQCPCFDSSN